MTSKREELLREAIQAETNMAELYKWYAEVFLEDKDFWETISEEEKKHASLIRLAQDILSEEQLSQLFIYDNLDKLKQVNNLLRSLIAKYQETPPEKTEAYRNAANLESSSFESFYQKKMTSVPQTEDINVLQKLNEDRRDHAKRIKELLENSLGK